MAEVIGLIASVVSIIEGVSKSKKYVHTSSSLRAELVPMLGKLTAFAGILRGLQLQCELDKSGDGPLQTLTLIRAPLTASETAVKTIEARLNRMISLGDLSFGFGKILDKKTATAIHLLDQSKPVLELALSADQRTLMKLIEAYVRNTADDLRDLRHDEKLHYEDLRDDLRQIRSDQNERAKYKSKKKILSWISQINYSSNFHAASIQIREEDGAGNWLIRCKEFEFWRRESGQSGLLLTGISGAGKTVLCAKVITELVRNRAFSEESLNLIYFFFDFNDVVKQTTQGMLRSLIYQLVAKLDKIPLYVHRLYSAHRDNTRPITPPSDNDWLDVLMYLLIDVGSCFIIIDALDECSLEERSGLQRVFQKLLENSTSQIKWLVTCRPYRPFAKMFEKSSFIHIEMKSDIIDHDIESYLSLRLSTDASLASFGPLARNLIISRIKTKASGMFRFAQCQLKVLEKLKDRRAKKVQEVLEDMPEDLYSTYSNIIGSLQPSHDWLIIVRILTFLTYSARPVSVMEVAEFVVLEEGMTNIDRSDRLEDFSEILFLINSLVHVQDGILSLAHQSVQEFLTTEQTRNNGTHDFNLPDVFVADAFIARKCLQYLAFSQTPICQVAEAKEFKNPNTWYLEKLAADYPLLDYAASRWLYHVRSKELQDQLAMEMKATISLTAKSNLWRAWLMLQRADIWEKQLELSSLVCEVSIRCGIVPHWACDFWQSRQNYRVTDLVAIPRYLGCTPPQASKEPEASRTTEGMDTKSETLVTVRKGSETAYMVKALYDFDAGDESEMSFRRGDVILVEQSQYGGWLIGSLHERKGQIPGNYVERYEFAWDRSFYDLGILLLEVALQTPLFAHMETAVEKISSAEDLNSHIDSLRRIIRKAEKIMGPKYGAVIRECLPKVYAKGKKALVLSECQEYAMEKLHSPLQNMLKSGFRVSRSPVPRLSPLRTSTGATPPETYAHAYVRLTMASELVQDASARSSLAMLVGSSCPVPVQILSDRIQRMNVEGPFELDSSA